MKPTINRKSATYEPIVWISVPVENMDIVKFNQVQKWCNDTIGIESADWKCGYMKLQKDDDGKIALPIKWGFHFRDPNSVVLFKMTWL